MKFSKLIESHGTKILFLLFFVDYIRQTWIWVSTASNSLNFTLYHSISLIFTLCLPLFLYFYFKVHNQEKVFFFFYSILTWIIPIIMDSFTYNKESSYLIRIIIVVMEWTMIDIIFILKSEQEKPYILILLLNLLMIGILISWVIRYIYSPFRTTITIIDLIIEVTYFSIVGFILLFFFRYFKSYRHDSELTKK